MRVKIPVSFGYTSNPAGTTPTYVSTSGGSSFSGEEINILEPVSSISVTISIRSTGAPATVYQAETGTATYTSLATDAQGNVPGWVDPGSYVVTASSSGSFSGATVAFEAVRGDGVTNIAEGAVDLSQLTAAVINALVPSGTILDYGSSVAPTGYVMCDGSVYAIGSVGSTYYNLYQAIKTNWNTGGEGSGNFRVPDLRGVVTVGSGSASNNLVPTTARSLATYGGAETVGLTGDQNGVHAHGVNDSGHSHGVYDPGHAHGINDPGHTHSQNASTMMSNLSGYGGGGSTWNIGPGSSNTSVSGTGIGIYNASTGIGINGSTTGISIQNSGSGSPHQNMQPFGVTNKIIKL